MKSRITQGPWKYVEDEEMSGCMDLIGADGNEIKFNVLIAYDLDGDDWNERNANGEAIVTAVNETYHKGIDPEGVPDMKEALILAYEQLKHTPGYSENPDDLKAVEAIEEALKKANLNEKAE